MNLRRERQLWKREVRFVAGVDEAGRGPLAGPVVASAVVVDHRHPHFNDADFKYLLRAVRDSKQLAEDEREDIYARLTTHPAIFWKEGRVGSSVIDQKNVLQATFLAMQRAVAQLDEVHHIYVDGNKTFESEVPQEAVVGGDGTIFSIAAASVIAKVRRDRYMHTMHLQHPEYGFDQHKGYGTQSHRAAIEQHGICPIHRRTFAGCDVVVE